MKNRPIILCVDDEKIVLDSLWDQISSALGEEFNCELCESGTEALELIDQLIEEEHSIAVVVSDQLMPDMRGDQFLIAVHQRLPLTNKIMLTGQASFEAVQNAINNARLYRYVPKPWAEDDLILTVTEAARSFQQHLQLVEYNRILKSLNKATQEISGEIEVQGLITKLMENVLENTGGENCYLVVNKQGELLIEASASKKQVVPVENLRHGLNGYTQRVLENITKVISNETIPLNCLIAPIGKNGANEGYIFVENEDKRSVFTQNQIEVIQMLASQATISLENARLYATNEERTRELEVEKEKVEQKNSEIAQRASEILKQKHELEEINRVVEQKNRDIMDSIHYAQRIQYSVMPDPNFLQNIFPESFIIYKPKDVVSGDFYWWSIRNNIFTIAVCDCTGHGVPGAFMSLMGVNFLNQVVNEFTIDTPSSILDYLHIQLRATLSQNSDNISKEGMDCAILVFDLEKNLVQFAGARRPLYHFRDGTLSTISGSKSSIGEHVEGKIINFENHIIEIQQGDSFYLFSDGITDQFGGKDFRKFTPKRLKILLESLQSKNMKEQSFSIEEGLSEWKGEAVQTDDIIILGIKLK